MKKERIVPARYSRECDLEERMEERKAEQGQSDSLRGREAAILLALPRQVKSMQNGSGFIRKARTPWPAEKERVASAPKSEQLARTL